MKENLCAGASAAQLFEAMHLRMRQPVERMIYCKFGRRHDVDDVLQEIFIKLWKCWDRLSGVSESELKDYIFIMTRNYFINERLQNERPKHNRTKFLAEYIHVCPDHYWQADYVMKEGLAIHQRAIEQLPKKVKLVYVLTYQDNLSADEIAKLLNKSRQTVQNNLSMANKTVRRFLNENYNLSLQETKRSCIKRASLN